MKFSPLYLLSVALATLLVTCQAQDLFSVKSYPVYSKFWKVEYFNTYKIATNLATNTSYLLYQNGTQPPSSEIGRHNSVIEIPLQDNVGFTSTPTIPFLELLGVQTRIEAYLGDKTYVASPCLLQLLTSGSIIDFSGNASNPTALVQASINGSTLVTFASDYDDIAAITNPIYISTYLEKSNAAVYEWLKFYALFFNLEREANCLCDQTFARANCVEKNAASITADNPDLPIVLWAYFSTDAQGWSLGTCPNYYCEFASACSATLVPAVNGSVSAFGANFLTDDEFLQVGKDADYWIFPSLDWDTIYASKQSTLDQFKSVVNKTVFDYQGSGVNAWFENRFVEYDVVIQDFCSVVGKYVPSPTIHKRLWFRNVFNESVGTLGQCNDPTAPLQSRATECGLGDGGTPVQCVIRAGKSTSAAEANILNMGWSTSLLLLLVVALFRF